MSRHQESTHLADQDLAARLKRQTQRQSQPNSSAGPPRPPDDDPTSSDPRPPLEKRPPDDLLQPPPSELETTIEDLIASKHALALNCANEIHRLTEIIKDLQTQLARERATRGRGPIPPLPYSDPSPDPSGGDPPPRTRVRPGAKGNPPTRITARGIRKVQSSMQFDNQDLVELFGEDRPGEMKDDKKVESDPHWSSQPEDKTDMYQVEIEISGKREVEGSEEDKDKTEYEVRKRISFSRWQTLADLKKEKLHDFVKIYDFKILAQKSQEDVARRADGEARLEALRKNTDFEDDGENSASSDWDESN